jgi:hypothetical protein
MKVIIDFSFTLINNTKIESCAGCHYYDVHVKVQAGAVVRERE